MRSKRRPEVGRKLDRLDIEETVKKRAKSLCGLCALALVACAIPARLSAKTQTQKHRTVVVISLDGFPAYALDHPRLPIPTLRRLAREGAVASSMRPVNPTVTWPNHTAIVTGVEPSEHHLLYNGLLLHPEGGVNPRLNLGAIKRARPVA